MDIYSERFSIKHNKKGIDTLIIDKEAYAGIHYHKKNTLIYINKRLTTDLKEVDRIFSATEFLRPTIEINPPYINSRNDSWFAKVYFIKSVSIDRIIEAIVYYKENGNAIGNAIDEKSAYAKTNGNVTRQNTEDETSEDARIVKEFVDIEKEVEDLKLEGIDRKSFVKTRINQSVFRERLLNKYGRCCLCGVDNETLLIASHIKPWAASKNNPQERTDVNNGLLLCPNHDKLFDSGLITFDVNGNIVISSLLMKNNKKLLNINETMHISMSKQTKKYMKYHRENVFLRKD